MALFEILRPQDNLPNFIKFTDNLQSNEEDCFREIKRQMKAGQLFGIRIEDIKLSQRDQIIEKLNQHLELHPIALSKGWCIPMIVVEVLEKNFRETWNYLMSPYYGLYSISE